jgi:hypothetical protein
MRRILFCIALIVFLTGFANPSVTRVNKQAIDEIVITRIFIPRFEGNPDFVEVSTDLFIAELEARVQAAIVQGSALRAESTDVLAGGNLAPTELAIQKAKEANAEVLILGKVTSHHTGSLLNGFSTVRVIDVATGTTLASFHRPSGKLIASSEHAAVLAAVSRTAKDVANALK